MVEGGQNVTLKGTVEQIVAQIKRVNPTYFARNSTIKASDHDESKAEAGKVIYMPHHTVTSEYMN